MDGGRLEEFYRKFSSKAKPPYRKVTEPIRVLIGNCDCFSSPLYLDQVPKRGSNLMGQTVFPAEHGSRAAAGVHAKHEDCAR
jgi:hypothetical protein